MRAVGEAVDHRLFGRPRQLEDVVMRAQTRNDSVYVTIKDPRSVGHRLAKADLHVLPGERGGRAAKPCDADLERDTRAVGRPLEEHGEVAAGQRLLVPAPGLDLVGQFQHLAQLPPVEVGQVDEVATLQRSHRSDHDRSPDYRPGYRRGSISSPATTGEIARSRKESNSGSRERTFGSSRSCRIRSRQAAGSSPKRAGLKLSGISCLIWIVRRSVTRRFGHECGSVSVTDTICTHEAPISCRPWITSSRSRKRARRAGGQLKSWTRHQMTTPAPA